MFNALTSDELKTSYVFREQIATEWADEIQHIAIDNVKMLIQYCVQM
jgi:hypothetical protein